MNYRKILITGGAGFVGSNICVKLKEHFQGIEVIAFDNLVRRGSELNIPRLSKSGIKFIHGDVRNREDLEVLDFDLLIECSAEPSVMAGVTSSPLYILQTNLVGAINCFEVARKSQADVVFLSTSRVYSQEKLNKVDFIERETRFTFSEKQKVTGASKEGISEEFPIEGIKTLYGTTKLSAEMILQEYTKNYKIRSIINRCSVISGPWQMGKVDQGIIMFWLVSHFFGKSLTYIGFGGKGKQVRDVLNIDDLFDLLLIQLKNIKRFSGKIYNVGGGLGNSISLLELTTLSQEITGKRVKIGGDPKTRAGDIRIYISDNLRIQKETGWWPKKEVKETLEEVHKWIVKNKKSLSYIFG